VHDVHALPNISFTLPDCPLSSKGFFVARRPGDCPDFANRLPGGAFNALLAHDRNPARNS